MRNACGGVCDTSNEIRLAPLQPRPPKGPPRLPKRSHKRTQRSPCAATGADKAKVAICYNYNAFCMRMGRHEELIMMAQMTNNNYSSISFPQEDTALYAYKYSSQSPPTATQTAARLHPTPAKTAPIYRLRFNAICMRIVCGMYAECMRNMFLQGPKNRPIGAPKAQTPHRLLGHLVVPPES